MTPEIRHLRRRLEDAKLRLNFAQNYLTEISTERRSDAAFQAGARRAVLNAIATANADTKRAFRWR